eukprot:312248_1
MKHINHSILIFYTILSITIMIKATQPVDIPGCPDLNQLISAWYDGDSIDLANNMWNDKSGNDQNGLLTGETFFSTSLNGEPVLNGDISDSVQFGNLNVNAKHTVFNL